LSYATSQTRGISQSQQTKLNLSHLLQQSDEQRLIELLKPFMLQMLPGLISGLEHIKMDSPIY
nr:hypothetical protein [Gallibacterium anatis]